MTPVQPGLFDLLPEEVAAQLSELGQPRYRARQILQWAYRGASSYEEMSDLPTDLRARLPKLLPLSTLSEASRAESADGLTRKLAFRLRDGALVESVRMLHPSVGGRRRATVCVSSQAGCSYGCRFCATGQQGYGRNLSPGEMVEQVLYCFREGVGKQPLGKGDEDLEVPRKVTNVVFMGMGEPFANYAAVRRAIVALNASWGLGLGARHITVSTVGLVPEIRRFAEEPLQAGLAVSLHAANDGLRSSLMPVNRKYPLRVLMVACREYVARTNRRITFEYVLLEQENDSPDHARELGELLGGLLCHVNLIPANPTAAAEFRRPAPERVAAFVREVRRHHIPVTLRDTQGMDIQAACGQLRVDVREGSSSPVGEGGGQTLGA